MFSLALITRPQADAPARVRAEYALKVAGLLKRQGRFEEAQEALDDFWSDVGSEPNLSGLNAQTQADLLILIGTLTREIVRRRRILAGMPIARRLLGRAFVLAAKLRDRVRQAEALGELGLALAQSSRLDVGRRALLRAEAAVGTLDQEVLAKVRMRLAYVEIYALNHEGAYKILQDSADLFDERSLTNHTLIGNFYLTRAVLYLCRHDKTASQDDLAFAYIDTDAARHHFETAGHSAYQAAALNNLALIRLREGNLSSALDFALRARTFVVETGDAVSLGQVDDTLARIYCDDDNLELAEQHIVAAIDTFERTNSSAHLEEALAVRAAIERKYADPRARISRATHLRAVSPGDTPRRSEALLSRSRAGGTMFTLQLAEDDFTLTAHGYQPLDLVSFTLDTPPEEGQLVAVYRLREEAYYIGYFHGDPTCFCHLDANGKPQQIVTLFYDDDPPREFPADEVTIIGTHATIRGMTH